MTLKEIISHENLNGEVYLSDCDRLLNDIHSLKLAKELQKLLTKIKNNYVGK